MSQPVQAGPVEQMSELAMPPGASQNMVLRYINGGGGFFVSSDSGSSWKMQCNSAFLSPAARVSGPTLVLGDKTVLMLSSDGVVRTDVNGCGAKLDGELTRGAVDLARHPSDAQRVFAAISNAMGMSGLVQRGADGQWAELGVKDTALPVSLRVAAHGGGLRFYELVTKGMSYAIRVSDDEAKTWQEYPLTVDMGTPRLRAVDPSNSERLLIVIERPTAQDTVLVSRDGGKTTTKYLEIDEPGGIAFAPDGKLWIGDLGLLSGSSMTRGLYAAANLEQTPVRLPMATYPVQCLGYAADTNTLYACQRFWFGKVDVESGAFTSLLKFSETPAFVTCSGEDTPAMCKAQLCLDYCGPGHFAVAPVCSAYDEPNCGKPVAASEGGGGTGVTGAAGGGTVGVAGAAAAGRAAAGGGAPSAGAAALSGGSAGSAAPAAEKKSGGCAAMGVRASGESGWALALVLAAVWLSRRRRR
ncbi:MAG TPA: hypothetical protein VJR89_36060 [Polyangiales bacterium]|nr:hypothetical protein [Polyangiales bacterium]